MTLDKVDVCNRIAALLHEQMDIDPELALQGIVFTELHRDFDSLALLELQLLLEKEFSMEFDGFDSNAKLPTNVNEMADVLMRSHAQYQQRQSKSNAAQPRKASHATKD